jgi:hypothetical protein
MTIPKLGAAIFVKWQLVAEVAFSLKALFKAAWAGERTWDLLFIFYFLITTAEPFLQITFSWQPP